MCSPMSGERGKIRLWRGYPLECRLIEMSRIKQYDLKSHKVLESEKKAIALMYDRLSAPTVKAKGEGLMADEIIELARSNGVYIAEDPALAELLSELEVDEEIPEALYTSIAVVLSWAYWIRGQRPE